MIKNPKFVKSPTFVLFALGSILLADDLGNNPENQNKADKVTVAWRDIHEYLLDANNNSWMNEDVGNVGYQNEHGESTLPYSQHYTTEPTTITSISRTLSSANTIQDECPEGLRYYSHFLGLPFCYVLTEKQNFPPKCPYQNYLEHDTITGIYKQFENQSIWMRAARYNEGGFGQFVWLDPSGRYLELVKSYEPPADRIMERNCLIHNTERYIPVACDEQYPVLCVYSYSSRVIGKYCSKRSQFINCISTSLDLDNKCYCQANIGGIKIPRQNFCTKLAEPKERFQNYMILSQLTSKSPCWFGIEHNGDGNFYWSSSKQLLDYTYWKENVNESKLYGALDYSRPKGWILEDNYALKCAICETELDYQNVTIDLKFLPSANSIAARIRNFFEIHNYFILQYVFACFTDANEDGMSTKILSTLSDLFPIYKQNYTKIIDVKNDYPSYYWCETLQRPNFTRVISNKILVHKNNGRHGHEYSLMVAVEVPQGTDPFIDKLHVKSSQFIKTELSKSTGIVNSVRPIKVDKLSQINQQMFLLLHVSSTKNSLTSQDEYDLFSNALNKIARKAVVIQEIINFSPSEMCLSNTTISGKTMLHWPETRLGATALPQELCLQDDSTPVTRKCEGDFLYGSIWGNVVGNCSENVSYTDRTLTLYDLLNSEQNSTELGESLCNATKNSEDVLVIDVHLVIEILDKLEKYDDVNITQVTTTFSNLMEYNGSVLNQAQVQLNSTDRALHILDQISAKMQILESDGYVAVSSKKVLIQISELRTSNVTGFAVKKLNDTFVSKPLYSSISLEALLKEDVDVAVFFPQQHIDEIEKCMEGRSEIKVIMTFFYDDILFNEVQETDKKGNSRIISVFIPEATCTFESTIPLVFKPLRDSDTADCAHWRYGNNDHQESSYGSWATDSEPGVRTKNHAICAYSHTTHFALLMFSENRLEEIRPEDVLALNIITAIGCALSLLGLAAIFITAIAFKSWRTHSRNIIMLNFSISLSAQMILLFVADNVREDTITCVISGASLHYTVLAEFAWMLIVAILQYRKFVLVFQKPIQYLVLKCVIVGWCLPLIPVVILFTVFPDSYKVNAAGICYPGEKKFVYGVAIPVGVIILINLFVFVKILLNICHRKIEAYGPKDNDTKLQVLLAILLFFLLGMSWIFGLAAAFVDWLILSYLFCLTATLQGFVIFLFFVVMNKKSRLLWLNIQKIFYCTEVRKRIT